MCFLIAIHSVKLVLDTAIIGIEFECLAETFFGGFIVTILHVNHSHEGVDTI